MAHVSTDWSTTVLQRAQLVSPISFWRESIEIDSLPRWWVFLSYRFRRLFIALIGFGQEGKVGTDGGSGWVAEPEAASKEKQPTDSVLHLLPPPHPTQFCNSILQLKFNRTKNVPCKTLEHISSVRFLLWWKLARPRSFLLPPKLRYQFKFKARGWSSLDCANRCF